MCVHTEIQLSVLSGEMYEKSATGRAGFRANIYLYIYVHVQLLRSNWTYAFVYTYIYICM